ncbi:MAG: glycosyl hydrolase family 28-related protein, partial [Acetobacterium sp.]|nr:glycosyl hydrolase family 28-related protein [Acetobacterium sp.]
VKNYGAKGDGVTDDSISIQNAINYASANNVNLIIPASSNYYKVNNTLTLKSNLHISGYGATLFMPSQASVKNIFISNSTTFIDNVSIEGLSLKSANDRAGTEYQINSLTSNVQGMYIQGISNFTMKDVRMDNMYDGLKLGAASNGVLNNNINIDNLQIYNSRTPLLMLATKDFVMSNSVLDANGGKTYFLHAAYIGGDTSNLLFNNVKFANSPGGGIHIYNGHTTKKAAQDIVVENSTFENNRVGAYVYSGASNITFSNNTVTNTGLAFKILSVSNVNINNVDISQQKYNDGSNGAFYIAYASTSQISDVTVDGAGMTGNLFDFGENVSDLTVSRLQVKNFPDNGVFNTPV